MKIIISHDVDHLYRSDHFHDLTYPKLWIRETIAYLKRKITFSEWYLRMVSPFKKERNYIDRLMDFENKHGIKSTFFFGMANGLGMSYSKNVVAPVIKRICDNGFEVGVHGICYDSSIGISKEYEDFKKIIGKNAANGIRMHYVRFDENTFKNLASAGYKFDSTEFNKMKGCCIKAPYKINNMWEFPVTVMDTYLDYDFESAKKRTLNIIKEVKKKHIQYITILFHDPHFCRAYEERKKWYEWLINYFEDNEEFQFISYKEAIKELESE